MSKILTIWLHAAAIILMSLLDGVTTVYLIAEKDAVEMNPAMGAAIEVYSVNTFLLLKMLLTASGTLLLVVHRAARSLRWLATVYAVLIVYELMMLLS